MTQLAASQPLEKLQRPETRRPPSSAGSPTPPAGFSAEQKSVSGPAAKSSSWTRSGKCPIHQL
jgi:hypothetical protein